MSHLNCLFNDPLLRAVQSGQCPGLLLLDYDGVLAPFTVERDQAFPYPEIKVVLETIPIEGNKRFVLVSGRDALEAARLLGRSRAPEIWGCHGAQRLSAAGELLAIPLHPQQYPVFRQAERMAKRWAPHHSLECKPNSLAVHTRGLPENEAIALLAHIRRAWETLARSNGMELHEFDGGLELRPTGVDKGRAVRVLAEENPGAVLAYLGDDRTDEDAFKALPSHGVGVLVRNERRKTAASHWIQPPGELQAFLEWWSSTP